MTYPDRALLHFNRLEDFKVWLDELGIAHRPTTAAYQVLQVHSQRTGDWVPIYKKSNAHEHFTVQARMVPLVRRYLKERKALG